MASIVRFRSVIDESAGLARRSIGWLVGIWSALTLMYLTADALVSGPEIMQAYGLLSLFALYLELLLTARLLAVAGLADYRFNPRTPTDGRYASAFLLAILSTLGILAGLILLVIPGLVLFARWGICFPVLLAERENAIESLRRSWLMTGPHWETAALVFVAIVALWVPAFVCERLLYPEYGTPTVAAALLVNIIAGFAWVMSWLLATALYVLIRQAEARQAVPADNQF